MSKVADLIDSQIGAARKNRKSIDVMSRVSRELVKLLMLGLF